MLPSATAPKRVSMGATCGNISVAQAIASDPCVTAYVVDAAANLEIQAGASSSTGRKGEESGER